MTHRSKIYVAGHCGMVDSAIVRQPKALGCSIADAPRNGGENAVIASEARKSMPPNSVAIITSTHAELDLTNRVVAKEFFKQEGSIRSILLQSKCPPRQKNL